VPGDWRGRTFGVDAWRLGGAVGVATALSIAQFLLFPRLLDVPTYGAFRVFVVYGVYAGVLHLGLPDGAYVRWAGRDAGQVLAEWRRTAAWLTALEAIMMALALVVATQVTSPRLAVTIAALGGFAAAANHLTLATCALQAIGEFRRAGMLAVLPPAALLVGILLVPEASRTLPVVLSLAVIAQVIPAVLAASWLRAARGLEGPAAAATVRAGATGVTGRADGATATGVLSPSLLLRLGIPVLVANLIAGLAQSVDRLLLSVAIPVEQFALYGFATSALVVANAVTQSFSRVALPHAARLPGGDRPAFYGRLHALIAAAFGVGLALYPLVEAIVADFIPAYVPALPIMRALLPGALVGVALQVVVFTSLLVRKAVRAQLAIAATVAVLVFLASGVAIVMAAPLWVVAVTASGALTAGWAIGTFVAGRGAGTARIGGAGGFALTGMLQLGALAIALWLTDSLVARTAAYAVLAAVPTFLAWRRAT
jgi:O-antigen/teichoic acid export membrane protein